MHLVEKIRQALDLVDYYYFVAVRQLFSDATGIPAEFEKGSALQQIKHAHIGQSGG